MKSRRFYIAAGVALVLHVLVLCWPVAQPEVVLPVILKSCPVSLGERQVRLSVKEKPLGDASLEPVPILLPPEVKRERMSVPVPPLPVLESAPVISSPSEKEVEAQEEQGAMISTSPSVAAPESSATALQNQGAAEDAIEVIRKASPLYAVNPPPVYPRLARKRGFEGVVELAVHVDVMGKVKSLRVSRPSGYHLLDKAAMKAVRRWRFKPGAVGGMVQEMWVTVPIRFSLSEVREQG